MEPLASRFLLRVRHTALFGIQVPQLVPFQDYVLAAIPQQ